MSIPILLSRCSSKFDLPFVLWYEILKIVFRPSFQVFNLIYILLTIITVHNIKLKIKIKILTAAQSYRIAKSQIPNVELQFTIHWIYCLMSTTILSSSLTIVASKFNYLKFVFNVTQPRWTVDINLP